MNADASAARGLFFLFFASLAGEGLGVETSLEVIFIFQSMEALNRAVYFQNAELY